MSHGMLVTFIFDDLLRRDLNLDLFKYGLRTHEVLSLNI